MTTLDTTTRLKPLCREVDVTENPRHLDGVDSLSYAMLLASYREGVRADRDAPSREDVKRWDHLGDADEPCPCCDVVGQPAMDHTTNARCVNTSCDVVNYRQGKD